MIESTNISVKKNSERTMEKSNSNFLNIDGFKLHYEVFEGLVDHDTLMIHGNLACNLWWYPAISELQKMNSNFDLNQKNNFKVQSQNLNHKSGRLVLADWRGCGLSKGLESESDINFDMFADDYLLLIDALNLKDIQVVGHSTGGLIAMLAILKQPHKFKNLVLLDSIGPLGIETPIPLDILLGHFEAVSKNEEICNMTIAATIQGVDVTTDYFKSLAKASFEVDTAVWRGVPETLCTKINITDKMKDLKLPVLILHGENDMVLPVDGSEKMHKMIKNSELKILKNQGHSFNVEDPKGFTKELESFWSK